MITPDGDCIYHKFASFMYQLTGGYYHYLLSKMYSAHLLGRKQIFSKKDMTGMLVSAGYEIVSIESFHEISLPLDEYIDNDNKRVFWMKYALCRLLSMLLRVFPIRNKMVVIAKKVS